MSQLHLGSEPSIEQLARALARVMDPNSPSRSELLRLEPWKILAVERDLSWTLRVVRAVKNTQLNANAPVNKLPREVLTSVLEYHDGERDLVVATHVCQHWRSTLTSCPSFWTRLEFKSSRDIRRALTYLERSKLVPIDITIDATSLQDLGPIQLFTPHIPRTRSFILSGCANAYAASSHLFYNPVPHLEHLQVYINHNNREDDHLCDIDSFLGHHAPLLRSLRLKNVCPILETPFPLPSLREIDLELETLRMTSLLHLCSNCPKLERIRVHVDALKGADLTQVTVLESVTELDFTYWSGCQVLPCLKLPRLKRLQASFPLDEQADKQVDFLPHAGHTLLAGTTTMTYSADSPLQTVELSGNGTDVSFTAFGVVPSMNWHTNKACIPWGQITHLKFKHVWTWGCFPTNLLNNVTVVEMEPLDDQHEGGLEALRPQSSGIGVPFPSLREIRCTCGEYCDEPVGQLAQLVRERDEAGYRLELVCMVLEYPLVSTLEELRRHVGRLEVSERRGW